MSETLILFTGFCTMIPKDYTIFLESLKNSTPEAKWPEALRALWWDAKEDWRRAHELVDGSNARGADQIHAYLHRKEGDQWNAGYWYRRAGKPFPKVSLDEEFRQLVEELL